MAGCVKGEVDDAVARKAGRTYIFGKCYYSPDGETQQQGDKTENESHRLYPAAAPPVAAACTRCRNVSLRNLQVRIRVYLSLLHRLPITSSVLRRRACDSRELPSGEGRLPLAQLLLQGGRVARMANVAAAGGTVPLPLPVGQAGQVRVTNCVFVKTRGGRASGWVSPKAAARLSHITTEGRLIQGATGRVLRKAQVDHLTGAGAFTSERLQVLLTSAALLAADPAFRRTLCGRLARDDPALSMHCKNY